MRLWLPSLIVLVACGSRTELEEPGGPCTTCDAGADVIVDVTPIDVAPPIDAPQDTFVAVCGNGVVEPGEQCDLGKDNGDKPAFLVTQTTGTHIETNMLVEKEDSAQFYDYYSASSHTGFEA